MTTTKKKHFVCSICREVFGPVGIGHDARPFEGVCCDDCNAMAVIPARLQKLDWSHCDDREKLFALIDKAKAKV